MIRCIVVDDEPLAIALLKKHIALIEELELIATCRSAMEAFTCLQNNDIDLLFLDIQMPIMTGMELLKTLDNRPQIILTTAYREYAIESYEWDVLDYLLKPISFPRFLKSVQKAIKDKSPISPRQKLEAQHIFVQSERKQVKIKLDEIVYIESLKDYIRIHLQDRKVMCKEQLGTFLNKLDLNFIRIHRSYIVNLEKVTAFSRNAIELGPLNLPIGVSYKKIVEAHLRSK